jgi:hypothetical protein
MLFSPKTVSLTGADTLVLGGRVLNNVADGDYATVSFPNDLAAVKTGKNGNSLYAYNTTGLQVDMTIRVVRSSPDDIFMNELLEQMKRDFAGFVLLRASFTKRVGNGFGFISADTYLLSGGVFTKQVEAKSNSEGDTEQSVSVYTLKFTNSARAIY